MMLARTKDLHREIVRFVQDFTREEGVPPTLHEIAAHMRMPDSSARYHILALESSGKIERDPTKHRSIKVLR